MLVGEAKQSQKHHWVEDWLSVSELKWLNGEECDWLELELEELKH